MEKNGYPAVNREKTIFMKGDGSDFIIHGLFVDDMMHVPTCERLKKEFMDKYSKDFDITGGGLMETFRGMHLDNYIRELLDGYKAYAQKSLRPKRISIQPGLILTQEDSPIIPEKRKQKVYRSFVRFVAKASIRCFLGSLRYFIYGGATCAFLCIGRLHALGSSASLYGISGARSEFQADVSSLL
jgi:hypothetical protein